jgi:hypothetical protein
MSDNTRVVKVGSLISTHTQGLLQVRSTYWTSGDPREPIVLLGEPGDAAAPPMLVVSLRYARKLLQIGMPA